MNLIKKNEPIKKLSKFKSNLGSRNFIEIRFFALTRFKRVFWATKIYFNNIMCFEYLIEDYNTTISLMSIS